MLIWYHWPIHCTCSSFRSTKLQEWTCDGEKWWKHRWGEEPYAYNEHLFSLFSCPWPQLRCKVSSVAHICFNFFLSRTSERWWLWHEGHFLFFIFSLFSCTPSAAYLSCICDLSFFYNLVQSGLVSGFHFFFIKIFNWAFIRKKLGGGYHIWAELMAVFLSQVDMHTRWSWSWSFTQICTLHTDLINLNHDEHF